MIIMDCWIILDHHAGHFGGLVWDPYGFVDCNRLKRALPVPPAPLDLPCQRANGSSGPGESGRGLKNIMAYHGYIIHGLQSHTWAKHGCTMLILVWPFDQHMILREAPIETISSRWL